MAIVNYLRFNIISQPDPNNPQNTIKEPKMGPHALFSGGLSLDLVVGIDQITANRLQKQNTEVNSPVVIKALLDTGCTITSIDNSIVERLNLKTIGIVSVGTASGELETTEHLVSLGFPGTALTGKVLHKVQSVNLAGRPFQALIGRDLMANWTITYNGSAGFVSIAD